MRSQRLDPEGARRPTPPTQPDLTIPAAVSSTFRTGGAETDWGKRVDLNAERR